MKNLYLPSVVFKSQRLVRPRVQLKQIMQKIAKNSYTEHGSSYRGLEPGTFGMRIRRADHSAPGNEDW